MANPPPMAPAAMRAGRPSVKHLLAAHHAQLTAVTPYQTYMQSTYPGSPCTRKRPCRNTVTCPSCWEHHARLNAFKTTATHIGQANMHQVAIPLPWIADPRTAREALTRIARTLRESDGFTRQSLWTQPFPNDPARGPQVRIEGVISGTDADPATLDEGGRLHRILERHRPPNAPVKWPLEVHYRALPASSKKHVKHLLRAGYQAGRPVFPTRRVAAGIYHDANKGLRVRFTNVHNRSHPTEIVDPPSPDGARLPDWTEHELKRYVRAAEEWRLDLGRPALSTRITLAPHHASRLIRRTRWRRHHDLPTARKIRAEYCRPEAIA